jgi:anti-sigma factor RsiW
MNETHLTTEQLMDYAHGELSAREDAAAHAHLASCAACTQARDEELRLSELLREHARVEEREMPPGLATSIYALAASSSAQPAWWQRLSLARPAIAIPLAAAVLLIAFFGIANMRGPMSRRGVDAAYYLENHAALASTMPFEENSALPVELTSDVTSGADETR